MKKFISTLVVVLSVLMVVLSFSACVATEAETVNVTLPKNPVGYTVKGAATATKGENYTFTVAIAEGYEKGTDFAVKVNGKAANETNGNYVVENVAEDLTIEVTGVKESVVTFTVTLPANPGGYTVGGTTTVVKGSNYEFTVTVSEGYEKTAEFAVKVNGKAVTEADGKYTVENVTENLTITVEGVSKILQKFTVTMPTNPVGYTVNGEATATEGTNYEFTVAISDGYEKTAEFAVKVNGSAVTETNGKYIVANVSENLTIEVTGVTRSLNTYTVTLPESPVGFTVNGATTVVEGKNYEFTVTISEGYKANSKFAVKVNGTVVTETEGKYTITNVTENLVVTVEGVGKVCNVTLPTDTVGFTVSGEATAVEGDNYQFTVTLTDGYKKGEDFEVTANGKAISEADGKYIVENVARAIVIEVNGVEEVKLNATFSGEGFDNALKNTNEEFDYAAENFTFKIELGDYFTQCAETIEVYYSVEGGEQTKLTANSEGVYSIANPHKDIAIVVKNLAKNVYKVSFYRNAVQKHSVEVTAEATLTAEQIDAAKAAVVLKGEKFVAWREDITAAIVNDTTFSAYTTPDKAFGEVINGIALDGATEVTLGEGAYSAAGGYTKVYTKSAVGSGAWAAIDLSAYTEVRFAFSLTEKWLLLNGWTDFADAKQMWFDVTMVNLLTGKWQVTVEGPVNHNGDDAGVRTSYTATYNGATLAEILSDWYSDSNAATVSVTELRGVKAEKYGEIITTDVPVAGFATSTAKSAPTDFANVYYCETFGDTSKFAELDISKYSEVKFYFAMAGGYIAINGTWGSYAQCATIGTDWIAVTMVNNYATWKITVEGKLSGDAVTDETKFVYDASGKTLKEVLNSWFSFTGADPKIYLTEVRGIKAEVKMEGEVIEGGVLTSSLTEDTTTEAPNGYEKVYKVEGTFDQEKKSTTDLSKYSKVTFAFKSEAYFLLDGWSIYIKDDYHDWSFVTMVNKGNNSWEVTIKGVVWTGAVSNPWTITYTGNSIATILEKWYNGSNIYVTELRGVLASASEETIAENNATWGEQVVSAAIEGATQATATVPNGYEGIAVFTKQAEII